MFKLRVTLKCGAVFLSEDRLDQEWANRLARMLRQCRQVASVEIVAAHQARRKRSA
jgi:hypothetical protein